MLNTLRWMAILTVALCFGAAQAQAPSAPQVESVIERLSEKLPEIRTFLSESETAQENAGWFGRSQQKVQEDLDLLLDEILGLVVGESYPTSRKRLFEIEDEIAKLDLAIGELGIARIKSPPSPAELGPVDWALRRQFAPGSHEAISAEIADKEQQKERLNAESTELIAEFRQQLLQLYAIALTNDQARSLIYQINGSSIVEASITYAVLQQLQARLSEIRATTDNEEIQRRYYGMAAALSLVAVRLHERHLAQYTEEWLPKIDDLDEKQRSLIAITEGELRTQNDPARREAYENNLLIQRNVASVIAEYRALLTQRQETVQAYLYETEQVALLSVNTLKTLENAIILNSQFTWNNSEFRAISGIDSMELIPLNNAEITQNYLDLSRQVLDTN